MSQHNLQIIIIGGGAAGFFSAIASATTYPHAQVTILEAGRKPLTKVRISGGGRCNVTHHCFDPAQLIQNYPRGGKALRGAFSRFQPQNTVAWFKERGVKLKTESDGRMFPVTDNSQTIIDCLFHQAQQAGVKLQTASIVTAVNTTEGRFTVSLKTGEILKCDRLLLATGSNPLGYRFATNLGHTIEPPVPSLFTFNLTDSPWQHLAGVSVEKVCLRLVHSGKQKLEQTGPLLITHWGISGPAVLKLSAWGARVLYQNHYHLPLLINWLPDYNLETIRQQLLEVKKQYPRRQIISWCPFSLPKRLWQCLVNLAGIEEQVSWNQLSKIALNKLAQALIQGHYQITGKGVFKEEFVTCGGVRLKEVNFKTMESKQCPGLYFAGEILDIDGVTGGFNFQSAWTTGWLAGQAMGSIGLSKYQYKT